MVLYLPTGTLDTTALTYPDPPLSRLHHDRQDEVLLSCIPTDSSLHITAARLFVVWAVDCTRETHVTPQTESRQPPPNPPVTTTGRTLLHCNNTSPLQLSRSNSSHSNSLPPPDDAIRQLAARMVRLPSLSAILTPGWSAHRV